MVSDIGTLNPDQMLQQQQILRQQKMAEMLMQQGMQQPQGQMVSGRYVAPSIFQNLAGLANQYVGSRNLEKAEQAQLKLANELRQQGVQDTERLMNVFGGRAAIPEKVTEMAGPYGMSGAGQNVPMPTATIAGSPAIIANPKKAYAEAINMTSPQARALLPQIAAEAFKKPEAFTLPEGAKRFMERPDGTVVEVAAGGQKLPAALDVAVSLIPDLPKNSSEWTPAQRKQVQDKVFELERQKASITNVNLPNEGERKAGFMSSILDRNIAQMQKALNIDPSAVKPNVPASIVSAIAGENVLSRSITPAQRQIIEDSQLDILDAALTLRTGAAYTREQLVGMRNTYFPRLGDPQATIDAKQARLETLLDSAFIAAGRATPKRESLPPLPAPPPAVKSTPAPAGVDQRVWDVMTVQEKALFKK
jgi:hypothetical protein